MNSPFFGVHYFLSGFSLIFKPGLKRFVIIPAMINIFLFIGLFFLLRHYVAEFNAWFAHFLPVWLQWLSLFFWLLFLISFFIIFIYFFVTLANIISAPFNSFLSEKVEAYLTGKAPDNGKTLKENLKDIPHIIARQLNIIFYYLPRALLFLICFFIPFVQTVAPLLWFGFNAWILALTYLDYPTDNHRVPMEKVRDWLRLKAGTGFGFGASVLIAAMIPFVNFFAIPAAVAGATKFWIEENRSSL